LEECGKEFKSFLNAKAHNEFYSALKSFEHEKSKDNENELVEEMIFIGNLWKISCLNDALFISVLDRIHYHIKVFRRVYFKFGSLICERIPEIAESHFKKFEEITEMFSKKNLIDELMEKRKVQFKK
jgi:hypothetical protein